LVGEGIDLTAYTSAANAADVDDLRQALGYSEWNLYGSSYGTRLALTIMRDNPDGVRSVVLDSVYPPQVDLTTTQAVSFERSLDLLFESCLADFACNTKYPDLKTTFYELAEQLDKESINFQLIRPSNSMFYDVILNGDRFIWITRELLYQTDQIPFLPERITSLQKGETTSFAELLKRSIFFDDFWSEGMFYSIQCAEEVPFSTEQDAHRLNDTVNPRLIQAIDFSKIFYPLCSTWNTNQPTAIENETVISDIPTLILSGEFDPVTPPAWGKLAAETLSNSQFLEFPDFGHGILGSGPDTGNCSKQIVNAFISNPDETADASCIDSLDRTFNP
jgi:pimeloyl-ACP methyl ester carboxylesterase